MKKQSTILFFLVVTTFAYSQKLTQEQVDSIKTNSEKVSFSLFQKAKEFQFAGKLDSAIHYFNRADSLFPDNPIVIHERGLVKSNLGKYDESIRDITRSIELVADEKKKAVYIENRGLTYLEMGEIDKACSDFIKGGKSGNCEKYVKKYCQ